MRVLAAALCDRASVTPEGKLDLGGVFHDLYAPGFPAKQNHLMLVLCLEWDPGDEGRYHFRVHVKGPGRRTTLTVEGHSDVSPRPPGRPPPRMRLAMPLKDVVFPAPGRYDFEVQAKGEAMPGPVLYVMRSGDDEAAAAGAGANGRQAAEKAAEETPPAGPTPASRSASPP